MAEFKKRMVSLAAYQDERAALEDERALEDADGDERVGLYYSGVRHSFEAADFLPGRAAVQAGRYTVKRKRTGEARRAPCVLGCGVFVGWLTSQ